MGVPVVKVCVIKPTRPFLVETGLWLVSASMIVLEEVLVTDFICLLGVHKPASLF